MVHTVALIDDDRNILTSVSMALEAEGFGVRTYTDGAEALVALERQPPDIAVLDIKMPRLDGMELLKKLRQKSNMPVIFLTSRTTRSTRCWACAWAPTTTSPSRSRSGC